MEVVQIEDRIQLGVGQIYVVAKLLISRAVVEVIGRVEQFQSCRKIKVGTKNLVDKFGDCSNILISNNIISISYRYHINIISISYQHHINITSISYHLLLL